jgi:hypothetical protein
MLTLWGPSVGERYCDGLSRRSFLRVGGLSMGGLALPALLQAETQGAAGAARISHKSVIMVYLSGGLAHQDTFDLKPEAPAGIRGEFKPIATRLSGVRVSELLPKLAGVMDRIALVRSIVGLRDEHSSFQNLTGFPMGQSQREGKPSFGSVIARMAGRAEAVVPPFVDLFPVMQHRPYNSPGPGFLGHAYKPVRMDGDDLALLAPPPNVSVQRFLERRGLFDQFDQFRRAMDTVETSSMSSVYRRAFEVLSSDRVAKALDVTREDPRLRERYGVGSSRHLGDGAPMWNDQLLIARRLVEAGAQCVTVAYGFWDTHGQNFKWLRRHLPLFDQGIAALVEDIYVRGLDRDLTVVVWGEFGRTPKINKNAGRDHWARVNSALLCGGGMNVGQVIGSTDKLGGSAASRPVPYLDVLATIYHNLGINPNAFIPDRAGRPISILPPTAAPIRELIA